MLIFRVHLDERGLIEHSRPYSVLCISRICRISHGFGLPRTAANVVAKSRKAGTDGLIRRVGFYGVGVGKNYRALGPDGIDDERLIVNGATQRSETKKLPFMTSLITCGLPSYFLWLVSWIPFLS